MAADPSSDASAGIPASAAAPAIASEQSWWKTPWAVGAALLLVAALLYAPAIGYGLLGIDDQGYYDNPALAGGAWSGLSTPWTGFFHSDYFPLTQLTWWLDLHLGDVGDDRPAGHLQSALWLGLGAWGVCAAVGRVATERLARVAAFLYVVHPLCAPSVLWLAERKNLVALAFAWWAIERHIAWRQGGGARAWFAAGASWLLVAAALLGKPHAVAIPLMLAAWEVFLATGPWWKRAAALVPASALAAGFTAVDLANRHDLVLAPLGGSHVASLWCDGPILARYLAQTVCPLNLTIYYPNVEDPGAIAPIALAWAAVIAVVAGTVVAARRRRLVAAAWGLAVAGLAPALNVVPQAVPATDHYVQWALPGLLLVVLVVLADLGDRLAAHPRAAAATATLRRPATALAAAALVAVLFGAAAVLRCGDFRDRDAFFLAAYRKQPAAAINIAGYVAFRSTRGSLYDPEVGAIAYRALTAPDRTRMLGFSAPPTIIAGGVEAWRRDGPEAAKHLVAVFVQGDDPELGLFLSSEILVGAGQSLQADRNLAARLGPDFLAQADALAALCRDGTQLPDRCAQAYTPQLRVLPEEDSSQRALVDFLRLGLLLAQIRANAGQGDSAFAIAALCLNIDPHNLDARGMVSELYKRALHRPDLAGRIDAGG
jgi:hypothetical protein